MSAPQNPRTGGIRQQTRGKPVIIDGQVLQAGPGAYDMADVREPLPYPGWGDSWLRWYGNYRNIRLACERCEDPTTGQVGIGRNTFYRYRDYCPSFAEQLPHAQDTAVERLEGLAWDMAINDRNPLMVRWLLERLRPELYNLKAQPDPARDLPSANPDDIEEARQQILGILLPSGGGGGGDPDPS